MATAKCSHCQKRSVEYSWWGFCKPCRMKYHALMAQYSKYCQYCGDGRGRVPGKCDPCLDFHMTPGARRRNQLRHAKRLELAGGEFAIPLTSEHKQWVFFTHTVVSRAVKAGLLPKLDGSIACVDCGNKATDYDHRDYSKPLQVDPVCRGCNARRGPGAMPQPRIFAAHIELAEAA